MSNGQHKRIDTHFHAVVLGEDEAFKKWGHVSDTIRESLAYNFILLYGRLKKNEVSDRAVQQAIIDVIERSDTIDHLVCLALDPVYDTTGKRRPERSNLWVDNDYILHLRSQLKPKDQAKVLLGASVHPYDPTFKQRVKKYVDAGAVLLKWIPSSQQIDLADARVRDALQFLGTAGATGGPLPLLVHTGPEAAIPSTDPRTHSFDFLCWRFRDRFWNRFRKKEKRWFTPRLDEIKANLRTGRDAGATIIFAHCGLPYFAPNSALKFFEHSDLKPVRTYLRENPARDGIAGKCYADVSAVVTPFRKSYFREIRKLPAPYLLAGSDWPVPVFELSADLKENVEDFVAIMNGDFSRIIVPEDNLIDVNWRELEHAFGKDHRMFRNAQDLLAPPLP